MNTTKIAVLLIILGSLLSSCQMLNQMAALSKCDFKYKSVSDVRVAGINVDDKKNIKDFSVFDATKLLTAVANNQFPLNLKLNIDIKNPNQATAGLEGGEWIFFIDSKEMLRGNVTQQLQIPAGGTTTMPMDIQINLKQVLKKESRETIANFGLNLASPEGKPTRVSLWIKPKIVVKGVTIPYNNYIKLGKSF